MDFIMNYVLGACVIIYIMYQIIGLFRRNNEFKKFLVKTSIALVSLRSLFLIDELAKIDTVFLSRVLVLASLVAFGIVIFLLFRKSPYLIIMSVVAVVLIYLTMQSVLVPSSEITSDPNAEVLIIDPQGMW